MNLLLFLAQLLLQGPATHAYAQQYEKNVMVAVTYTDRVPTETCVEIFGLDDPKLEMPVKHHCWNPDTYIGDVDVWENLSINDWNFRVIVRYPNGKVDVINLTSYVDS